MQTKNFDSLTHRWVIVVCKKRNVSLDMLPLQCFIG